MPGASALGPLLAPRLPALTACLAVAGFLALEGRSRGDAPARSLAADESDRGTTRAVGAAFAGALIGPPVLAALPAPRLSPTAGWVGAALAAAGTGLRLAAAQSLGTSYTRTLRVRDDQAVVETGLYAHVRHPGYAGTLALLLGYALSWQSAAALLPVLPLVPAYTRRMAAEEQLLEAELGQAYTNYRRRTRRVLPGIY